MTKPDPDSALRSWRQAAAGLLDRRVLAMGLLGFSAGTPLLLVFGTLSVWLREAGIERATISMFSWAALAYAFKFVWAPLIDRLPVPVLTALLGRRRGWLLVAQAGVIAAIVAMAHTDPRASLVPMAVAAVCLGFAAATQDIVIDAYRIEVAPEEMQSLLSAAYITGYRTGMLVAGFGALELAGLLDPVTSVPYGDWLMPYGSVVGFGPLEQGNLYHYGAWRITYLAMAAVMGIGVITTLVVREPSIQRREHPHTTVEYLRFLAGFALAAAAFFGVFLNADAAVGDLERQLVAGLGLGHVLSGFLAEATRFAVALAAALSAGWLVVVGGLVPREMAVHSYVDPFADFFRRYGKAAVWVLALIAVYRVSDVMLGVIANVFYTDIGFSKQEIGAMSKAFGLGMTLAGGFLGGVMTERWGVNRVLFLGGVLAAATNLLFSLLAQVGNELWLLAVVIAADNLSGGIATTAFIAFLSSLTSRDFTASQYAVFSSLMLLLPKLLGGYSGAIVDAVGYPAFFATTALAGVPVLFLIWRTARLRRE